MKRILSLVLVIVLCLGLGIPAMAARTENVDITHRAIKIVLNGEEITPCDAAGNTVEPFIMNSNSTTYLPLRAIGQALGLNVSWDSAANTVGLTTGGPVISGSGPAGSSTGSQRVAITYRDIKVFLSGRELELKNALGQAVEPFILNSNSSVYLPLRVVGEAFGLQVKWDGGSSTVYLDEPAGETPPEEEEPGLPLSIISYLPDAEASVGDSLSFSFSVAGGKTPYSYQWQCIWDGSEDFENIDNRCKDWASGWYTDTLTMTVGEKDFLYNYRYRLLVTDALGSTVCSNSVGILPAEETPDESAQPISILSQPKDAYAIEGDTVSFSCAASGGSGELRYTWQYQISGESQWYDAKHICLSGWDSAEMSISPPRAALTKLNGSSSYYTFRCLVSDSEGSSALSNTARIYEAFCISAQPENIKKYLSKGETAFTSVSLKLSIRENSPVQPKYQWQYTSDALGSWRNMDNGSWSLATTWNSDTLIFNISQSLIDKGYRLRCIVSSGNGGSITSDDARLYGDPLSVYIWDGTHYYSHIVLECQPSGGSGDYEYEWYYMASGSDKWLYAGNLADLTIERGNYGKYYCIVTDSDGNICRSGEKNVTSVWFY